MKKVVPFTKTITFKTVIAEITDIEVNHTLSLKRVNEIDGDILVDGKYIMTDASRMEEEFHYKLPCIITIDSKYKTESVDISIKDFSFEIINEEDLKINVEIEIDGLTVEEELINNEEIKIPIDEVEEVKEVIEKEETDEKKEDSINSIFSNITSNEETFSTYNVYIIGEHDTLDTVIDKYKVTKEELSNYNDLDDIRIGSKIIIPCSNE